MGQDEEVGESLRWCCWQESWVSQMANGLFMRDTEEFDLTNILGACTPLPADDIGTGVGVGTGAGASRCCCCCCCCAAFGTMLEGHPFGGGC